MLKLITWTYVRQGGSQWRTNFKLMAFNMLHHWGVKPNVIQAKNMSTEEQEEFTRQAVRKLLHRDAFCDYGLDQFVCLLYSCVICLG